MPLRCVNICLCKNIKGITFRSSHRRCSVRKVVLRNFAKFTGKHLYQSLFLNKAAGLRPEACNFIKKETLAQVFFCEFCEISKNTFFIEHLWAIASTLSELSCSHSVLLIKRLKLLMLLRFLIIYADVLFLVTFMRVKIGE